MKFWETFQNISFIIKARVEGLRDIGPCVSPFNSFLFLQGIETLSLRMDRHLQNTLAVAKHLESHKGFEWVKYAIASLEPLLCIARKYTPLRRGRRFFFGLKGGYDSGQAVHQQAEDLFASGECRRCAQPVIHPASTTHQQLAADEQVAAGVTPELVRLSIGLEDVEDLIWDLDQALT